MVAEVCKAIGEPWKPIYLTSGEAITIPLVHDASVTVWLDYAAIWRDPCLYHLQDKSHQWAVTLNNFDRSSPADTEYKNENPKLTLCLSDDIIWYLPHYPKGIATNYSYDFYNNFSFGRQKKSCLCL